VERDYLRVVGTAPAHLPDYNYEDRIEDLRGLLWAACKRGQQHLIDDIAVRAHLAPSTVEAFVFGQTKRPQDRTVFEIAKAIGFRMALIPLSVPKLREELDRGNLPDDLPRRKTPFKS